MRVPEHMHITASLMAGYTFEDGSLLEVDSAGDYRITDAQDEILAETVDTTPGEGNGLRMGTRPEDYGDIADDLAAFLRHDGDRFAYMRGGGDTDDGEHYIFGSEEVARWAMHHEDELSILANYREDKRLGEADEEE